MENEIKTWLADIKAAIQEIDSFLPDKMDFLAFQKDLKARRAVERNLEIIGEAASRINKKDSKILLTNSRKIIDTRNRIIHGYDTVSEDIIWAIVIKDLPKLKLEVDSLLK